MATALWSLSGSTLFVYLVMVIWTAPVTSEGGSTDTTVFDTTGQSHSSLCCPHARCRVAAQISAQLDVPHHVMMSVSAVATQDLEILKLPTQAKAASSSSFAHLSVVLQNVASQGGQVDQQNKQTQVGKGLNSKSVDLIPTRLKSPAAIVERRINRAKILQPQKGLPCLHI